MISKETKILEFNQYSNSDKAPCIIYADLKPLIVNIDGCKKNMNVNRGKDCMKTFSESLREHAMKIINIKRKK